MNEDTMQHMSMTLEPSAKNWLFTMMETLSREAFVEMAVTLWAIWFARRRLIHDGEHQSPLSTYSFVRRFIEDLATLPVPVKVARSGVAKAGSPKWLPPPPGYIKINVDAATSKTGGGGVVPAVCRCGNGDFMGASALTISDIGSAATLEALACREALALAQDLNVQSVWHDHPRNKRDGVAF
jgi:hypothetical protein